MRIRTLAIAAALAGGFAVTLAAPVRAQTTAELALRVERLEAQLREMTGLIDALTTQLLQMQQLVDVLRADNEALYQLLAGTGAAPAVPAADPAAVPPAQPTLTLPPVTDTQPVLGTPPTNLGVVPANPQQPGAPLDLTTAIRPDGAFNLTNPAVTPASETPPATDPAIPLPVPETPAAPAAPAVALTGVPQADYDTAYQYLLNGDYALAEEAFRAFVNSYPGNALAADAQFWLAESLYARGLYQQAAAEYLDVYIRNRTHAKAPDMLLKLGMSLVQLGERQSACDTFNLILVQFPNASNALRQRLSTEMTNAGC